MTIQKALPILIDPNAGANLLVLEACDVARKPRYRPVSVRRYRRDVRVNITKRLLFPHLRGTWLPSVDRQTAGFGFAINWFGIRIRVDLLS
jgi:hypothetical protein